MWNAEAATAAIGGGFFSDKKEKADLPLSMTARDLSPAIDSNPSSFPLIKMWKLAFPLTDSAKRTKEKDYFCSSNDDSPENEELGKPRLPAAPNAMHV